MSRVSRFLRARSRVALLLTTTVLLLSFRPSGQTAGAASSDLFMVSRSIDLLGEVYREVSGNYVDPIDVSEFMLSGIDGMLEQLDPYTTLLDEGQSAELDEMTSGHYAGIGVTFARINEELTIVSVHEGGPAARAGLKIGDVIVSVGGQPLGTVDLDGIRSRIKGSSGSTVRLGIRSPGRKGRRSVVLIREDIRTSTITGSALFGSMGYVGLESFGEHSAEELREALAGLQAEAGRGGRGLQGVVFDLRGNPGGLLTSAVDVASLFVGKGSRIVSTRGQTPESEQVYETGREPLLASVPLVVLIDGESASASEIVAGAIQELDRGVVIGEGSFGKGLVQSILPLPYDHVLKLTTSKYYTPSGRLIQKPFDREKDRRRTVVADAAPQDSSKVFYTRLRRKVYGGGGIKPDIAVSPMTVSDYEQELDRKGMFFRYAVDYRTRHAAVEPQTLAALPLLQDFNRFIESERFTWRTKAQLELDSLRRLAGTDKAIAGTLDMLEKQLAQAEAADRMKDSTRIVSAVRLEVLRHFDEKAARKAAVETDPVTGTAFSLLGDTARYKALLKGARTVTD